MLPFFQFVFRRSLSMLITLLVISAVLYGIAMLAPVKARATLYLPERMSGNLSEERMDEFLDKIIVRYHLDDPYPVQYLIWLSRISKGDWGYSPALKERVLAALLSRTPATLELTIYSLILFVPLGIVSGVIAGQRPNSASDNRFRISAFVATSVPAFIIALILLSIFYARLGWFPPERLGLLTGLEVKTDRFILYTGMWTVDGLLNGRPDITLDAFRHLALPVITLSLLHWATLARITRVVIIEELGKEYVTALRARGLSWKQVVWKHTLRNGLSPILTSTALSAASLVSGVYVVEIIFRFNGVSEIITSAFHEAPDAPAVLGFAMYSVVIVLLLMWMLDLLQALLDPRVREGVV